MPTGIHRTTIGKARALRRSMTDGERRLWSELRAFRGWYGVHFRRQAPVGRFIVDFVAHTPRLVIEVDGEHHQAPERIRRDQVRDAWLAEEGYRTLRLTTGELADNFDGCIEEILRALDLLGASDGSAAMDRNRGVST